MNHYDFGNYLTEKRKSIGYSQFQFGKLLGVSGKAVSKWETGASVPKLETLTKIASLTGTDLGDLVSMREVGDFEITKIRRSKKAAFWNREENRLAEIYGDDVPLSILDRYYTEKELTAFTDSPLILDALGKVREMVTKKHGLMTNGLDTNASFIAWLAGATNINPLPPHQICPHCRKLVFLDEVCDAWDAGPKKCTCGTMMVNDGHKLPFDACRLTLSMDKSVFGIRLPQSLIDKACEVVFSELNEIFSMKKLIFPDGSIEILLYQRTSKAKRSETWEMVPSISKKEYVGGANRFSTILFYASSMGNNLMEKLALVPTVPDITEMLHEVDLDAIARRFLKHSAFFSGVRKRGKYYFSDVLKILLADNSTFSSETLKDLVRQTGVKTWKMLPLSREDVWDIIAEKMGANGVTSVIPEYMMRGGYICRNPRELEQTLFRSLSMPKWFWNYLGQCKYLSSKSSAIDQLIEQIIFEWVDNTVHQ